MLVLAHDRPNTARVVGVFPSAADARRGIAAREDGDARPAACVPLPLQPTATDTSTGSDGDDGAGSLPAVVVLDTTVECVVYGPFPDSLGDFREWCRNESWSSGE